MLRQALRMRNTVIVLSGVVFLGTLLAMIVLTSKLANKYEVAPIVRVSVDAPEEVVPQEIGYTWKGMQNDPKRIIIPSIGVEAYIQNVGVDQNNQIAVPNNIHIAGWFVDSVVPGELGLSIIDGHVNGPSVDEGVFKRLPELSKDQEVIIQFGDDRQQRFKVYETHDLETSKVADVLYSQIPDIDRQLNLITCTGTYDAQARSYSNRNIVVLEAI